MKISCLLVSCLEVWLLSTIIKCGMSKNCEMSHVDLSSDIIPVKKGLYLFPNLTFPCNGLITGWTYRLEMNSTDNNMLIKDGIEIWSRSNNNSFIRRMEHMEKSKNLSDYFYNSSSNLVTCTLLSTISVTSNDFIGLATTNTNLAYVMGNDTLAYYTADARSEINYSDMEVAAVTPLITAIISGLDDGTTNNSGLDDATTGLNNESKVDLLEKRFIILLGFSTLVICLLLGIAVGIFIKCRRRKQQKSTSDYHNNIMMHQNGLKCAKKNRLPVLPRYPVTKQLTMTGNGNAVTQQAKTKIKDPILPVRTTQMMVNSNGAEHGNVNTTLSQEVTALHVIKPSKVRVKESKTVNESEEDPAICLSVNPTIESLNCNTDEEFLDSKTKDTDQYYTSPSYTNSGILPLYKNVEEAEAEDIDQQCTSPSYTEPSHLPLYQNVEEDIDQQCASPSYTEPSHLPLYQNVEEDIDQQCASPSYTEPVHLPLYCDVDELTSSKDRNQITLFKNEAYMLHQYSKNIEKNEDKIMANHSYY